MSASCQVCGQTDDSRPICQFQPKGADQELVSVHAFCGKIASISYSKPQFEIMNAAQIKNKYKGGHSVQTAMSQTRSASPNGDPKSGVFYLTKEFEAKLKQMVDWNAKPPPNGNMPSAASFRTGAPAGYVYNPKTQQYSRASGKGQIEKRLKRHRSTCPAALWPRIQRAQVERHYLVTHTVPATGVIPRHPAYGGPSAIFSVLGSTGVAYDVTVCKMPSCTCPDHTSKQNTHQNICSHILFVMLKVIGLEASSNLVYQSALLEAELKTIFEKFRGRRDEVLYGYAKLPKLAVDPTPQTKQPRKPLVNATCPICFDAIDNNNNDVTYCQAACGTNFHLSCFQMWSSQPASRNPPTTGTTVICHFCRHNWIASPLDHAVYEQHHQQQQQQQQYTYVTTENGYETTAATDPNATAAPVAVDPNVYQYATQTQQQQQPQTQYVTQQAQPQYETQPQAQPQYETQPQQAQPQYETQPQQTYATQPQQNDWYAQQQQVQQPAPAPAPAYQQQVQQPAPAPEGYAYQPAPVYQQQVQQPAPAPAPAYQQQVQQPAPAPAPAYQQQHVEQQVSQAQPAAAPTYHQPAPAPVYQQQAQQQPAPAPAYQQQAQQPAPAPAYHQQVHQQPAPAPAPAYHQVQQQAPEVKQEDFNGDMNGANKRQKVV